MNSTGSQWSIAGGETRGNNLFHSFQEFSLPTGNTAFFNNAIAIDRIIARVTGGQVSNIDGLIRANGTADLFLINPTGIIFGPNARLDIGGSFVSSTADSIQFADGTEFSAANSSAPPLLTISVPVGLQFGQNTGTISVSGKGHRLTFNGDPYSSPLQQSSNAQGLQVKPGRTLALLGSQVTLDGGILTAESGGIELGGVSIGQVVFNPTGLGWIASYPQVQQYGDVRLSAGSLLDARGGGGSGIQIAGRQVTMSDGSLALTDPLLGSLPGGAIVLSASELVSASGLNSIGIPSGLRSQAVTGKGGAITVSTPHLILSDGGYINSVIFGMGNGGDINLDAFYDLQLIGASPFSQSSLSGIESGNYGAGRGGNVSVATARLQFSDGGILVAATYSSGTGGNVQARATDSIEVTGFNRVSPTQVRFRSAILAETIGSGEAGNLTLDTARLTVKDGARIGASTAASGTGGILTVNASESVEVSGVGTGTSLQSSLSSSALANLPIQRFLGLPPVPSGDSGVAVVNTPRLIVSDRALVGVDNQGSGRGGDLTINAQQIVVEDGGRITAATASGVGGNVHLSARNFLLLRNGSQITAQAGGTGNGGNITIDSPFVVAVLNENSDIIANAFAGNGGNINITTNGIFGLVISQGPLNDTQSEINASSRTGIAGIVAITRPEISASAGLVELPQQLIDPSNQVVVGCAAAEGNSFTITGRGGLPEDPTEPLRGQTVWEDWQDWSAAEEAPQTVSVQTQLEKVVVPVVEAKGWIINTAGNVELVANREGRDRIPPLQSKIPQCTHS